MRHGSGTLSLRRLGAAFALTAGLLAIGAPAAHAEDPVDLAGAYVLDTVGAIAGDEAKVQAALDSLYERARIQLFVVYVDSFTGVPAADWADTTAINNGLGANDLLLAVAIEDRNYQLSIDSGFPLSDAQLDDVEANDIEPALRNDDWAGAAIAAAQGLEAAATGVVGPNVPTDPGTGSESTGGGIPVLPIVGGVAVVGVGVFIYSRIRKRGKDGTVTSVPEQMSQKELDRRAGSLLVQLDDSLKTSEQELGFAVAQFGEAATADFTATLESAKTKVKQAFTIKQRLDDSEPDSEADQRAWTTEIIQLCEAADAELDAQADAFDDLRQLEKNAPDALAEVRTKAAAAAERKSAADGTLAQLAGHYSPAALKPVSDNIGQAAKLLTFADAAADKATAALGAGQASEAAIAVRTAQASVGQAGQLFDAIDTLAADLAEASAKLEAAVADTSQDIAAARALPADTAAANLAPVIAAAETALAAVTPGDPVASLGQVETANAALEQVFVGVRDEQQKISHARTQLDASITGARAQITSAMEYITTRRGGIGESARTRVSEADRHLAQAIALAASDPVAALAEAQRANQLGASAFDLARRDVSSYESYIDTGSRDNYGGGFGGADGADLGGLLGGLIGGMLGSGSGSRSSSGSSGGWSGGGSSRSSRSGSFGGSSRSSSRSSGSRGGRSRGGRF